MAKKHNSRQSEFKIAFWQGSKPFPRRRTKTYGDERNGAADTAKTNFQLTYNQKAYVALTALVILGAFTLILAVSLNKANITDLKLITSEQISNESFSTADACIEEALLRLKRDSDFTEGNLNISTANCTISITADGDRRTIVATGVSEQYTREIETTVDLTTDGSAINVSTVTWEEK